MTDRAAPDTAPDRPSGGLAYGLSAYLLWGLLPLYVHALGAVPGLEFIAWRVMFGLPVCLAMLAALRRTGEARAAVADGPTVRWLAASAALIGFNWVVFTYAVQSGHVLATSLGYYINPLVNILLGTAFLHERLSRLQWAAVGLAALGVGLLAAGAVEMLWISLALAFSFAGYGLVRKLAPVSGLAGLVIETAVMAPLALGYLVVAGLAGPGLAFAADLRTALLLVCAGPATAVPLFLFAEAARRLDLSTLGFVQFCTPTLTFLTGLFVLHEPLRPVQLACFGLIWVAIGLFMWDQLARARRSRREPLVGERAAGEPVALASRSALMEDRRQP